MNKTGFARSACQGVFILPVLRIDRFRSATVIAGDPRRKSGDEGPPSTTSAAAPAPVVDGPPARTMTQRGQRKGLLPSYTFSMNPAPRPLATAKAQPMMSRVK